LVDVVIGNPSNMSICQQLRLPSILKIPWICQDPLILVVGTFPRGLPDYKKIVLGLLGMSAKPLEEGMRRTGVLCQDTNLSSIKSETPE
jgi:hypothetical protein